MIKPDYNNFGLSYPMGEILRDEVERQLSKDIRHYGINNVILRYDWSESCIEGRTAYIYDGHMDNYSDIKVFDSSDEIIAEGWMDFIYEKEYNLFIVYWDLLDIYESSRPKTVKSFGMPDHVYQQLTDDLKIKYKKDQVPNMR